MNKILVAGLAVILLTTATATAQTVVAPSDVHEIRSGTGLSFSTYVGTSTGTSPQEFRLFFEFDFSGYGTGYSAVFTFSGAGATPGPIYLQPMTSGEDGTVAVGDWSLLGAPIWTGSVTYGQNSFTVPLTSWFQARAGGFGGFALTNGGSGSFLQSTSGTLTLTPTAVPEPGTIALFGFGLMSLFVGYRSRRKRSKA